MILSYNNKRLYIIMSMKKTLILAAAMLGMSAASMAQSQVNTYSVYDVNRTGETTVADAAMVVQRAVEAIREDPQVVDAAQLNAILESIDARLQQLESVEARLAAIEEKLGIEAPGDPEPEVDPANGYEYVDLGMVVDGKKILWATCNIGADSPEDTGLYFAWGETVGHTSDDGHFFDWSTAPFNNGNSSYNSSSFNSVKDEVCPEGVLAMDYDAAHVNWQGNWRMPTNDELAWLIQNTSREWQGNGYLYISNINSQTIFFPAAGYHYHQISSYNPADDCEKLAYLNEIGYYWSSSLDSSDLSKARNMQLIKNNGRGMQSSYRYLGYPIRPVCVVAE